MDPKATFSPLFYWNACVPREEEEANISGMPFLSRTEAGTALPIRAKSHPPRPAPPPPRNRSGRECRRGSQAPGGSSKHGEGAGLALVPDIRTSPPLPDVLSLHLILILRLFHLTFKKEDQPLQLSLPQDLRVLQGQSPQVCMSCSAQLRGRHSHLKSLLTLEVMTVFKKMAVSLENFILTHTKLLWGLVVKADPIQSTPSFPLLTLLRDSSTVPGSPSLRGSQREGLCCQSPGPLKC